MINYKIEPTRTTPHVCIDSTGIIEISGRSAPENSISFYTPIMQVLERVSFDMPSITFNFAFEYFNTSSGKCLFDLLRMVNRLARNGKDVEINWFYDPDDEDMREIGEDYEDILDMDFTFLELEDEGLLLRAS